MACKDAKKKQAEAENFAAENTQPETKEATEEKAVDRLFFGGGGIFECFGGFFCYKCENYHTYDIFRR